jgi:hypothetical protein
MPTNTNWNTNDITDRIGNTKLLPEEHVELKQATWEPRDDAVGYIATVVKNINKIFAAKRIRPAHSR